MKKLSFLFLLFFNLNLSSLAVEGMWIPSLIDLFHSDMKTYGLRLSPEEVYATNKSSLKDAVIQFNGGCTAEIVSDEGLLLTNHHCGLDAIQRHSSKENDYLKNGFWSKSRAEELACPWLRVTFVREIRDVTVLVMAGVKDEMSDQEKVEVITKNIAKTEASIELQGKEKAKIKAFNLGNEYFMLITEDYNDIRLVGAPPTAIGKFGGDTDNWIWPRHTGDFSVFRIYANGENKSAPFETSNQPYRPDHSFPISLKPKKVGDFTMVYGFPGRTDQHLTSGQLEFYQNKERPARIGMRERSLTIIKPAMAADDGVRIKYTSKQARIANYWKKWIGQIAGLKELNALEKKKRFEEEYMARAGEKSRWKAKYYGIIAELNKLQADYGKYELARSMFYEYFYLGPEFLRHALDFAELAYKYDELVEKDRLEAKVNKLMKKSVSFYKNYDKEVDRKIFHALSELYAQYVDVEFLPLGFWDNWKNKETEIFSKSILLSPKIEDEMLTNFSKKWVKKLQKDPGLKLAVDINNTYVNKVNSSYQTFKLRQEELLKIYVEGMLMMFPEKKMWADANSTMRIAYGKIDGSTPYDGMQYTHYTTIEGIIQKNHTGDPDFYLTDRFFELYRTKDFGQYEQDGELWVCFTASNHTTGGNSGSPVIDADGNLMGINFDRSWESTMSDFVFDESRCRNIIVDIRYVLWVIEKYGDAPQLIEEMNLIP